ncbi:Uncharacterised protein [Chlamydia trachomatis]|nr:Uncharacterised protein [Chlamydia trachomatis]
MHYAWKELLFYKKKYLLIELLIILDVYGCFLIGSGKRLRAVG